MKDLSILIPTYNDICVELVTALQQQAETLGINYEIIVGDDGSTDQNVLMQNRSINRLSCCRVEEHPTNIGRAAIRNFLAQKAQYPWLLFIDCGMSVEHPHFLKLYQTTDADVIDGGITTKTYINGNLRSIYEHSQICHHTYERRSQAPYQHFRTANFMIRREVMLQHPFDIRFRNYGYEDVIFGKTLRQYGISIQHINNSLNYISDETNEVFVRKTEEGLRTLRKFRDELTGYSRLLDFTNRHPILSLFIKCWHYLFGAWERTNLCSSHPSLRIFLLYRIGYFLSLR